VFSALQTSLSRSGLGRRFHREIHVAHARIAEAIDAADEDAAAGEMKRHLEFLVPYYERAWKDLRR
jgi:DNA-binding FadR family transcriptional regulator